MTSKLPTVYGADSTVQSNRARYNRCRDQALHGLRHHSFLRTNQFDVENRLDGLIERFRIQHREELADELNASLASLAKLPSKWHPEILHLLLELADQPYQKTRLDQVDHLNQQQAETTPPLTWEEIAREDGWNEDPTLWQSIDYGDSSGTDAYHDEVNDSSGESDVSSVAEPNSAWHARPPLKNQPDKSKLEQIIESQSWRLATPHTDAQGRDRKVAITEFQVVRDVLFMLQGLPTSLFDDKMTPSSNYQLATVSWDQFRAITAAFSEIGLTLKTLRDFAGRPQSAAHLQVFRASVEQSLQRFDQTVSQIESRLVGLEMDTVVSLLAVLEELKPCVGPLRRLSSIAYELLQSANAGAFTYLELLFDEVEAAQLAGDASTYEFLARIFFDCFQVYLRPIKLWMQDGQLIPGDKLFFVSESPARAPLNQVWDSQYKLRRTHDGKLHAPRFLQPSARKIFTAGKSIVVLKLLGKYEPIRSGSGSQDVPLTFNTVCPPDLSLAPFAELFQSAFEQWIQSKHQATSETLKRALFDHCDLAKTLDSLDYIYLMSDGSLADLFSHGLFFKLDSLKANWHDRYSLTGLMQEAFATRIDTSRLTATVTPDGQKCDLAKARDSVKTALPEIRVVYRLPWAVQLVLTEESIKRYQQVYTFLLQIRRAAYPLNQARRQLNRASLGTDDDEHRLFHLLRAKLVWFCNVIQTYLATLVLAPNRSQLRHDLGSSHDVDAMISGHLAFTKRIMDEACLGTKLVPIREAISDLLDLSLKLERAAAHEATRSAEEAQELSRLSLMSSPLKGSPRQQRSRPRYVDSDSEDGTDSRGDDTRAEDGRPYGAVLKEIGADFERGTRFVVGGLRGVARATSDPVAAKWDILAEMLEGGFEGES